MQINYEDKSVLIVDDFPQFRSSLKGMLNSIRFGTVMEVSHASQAIELLEERRFDVYLVDYNLSEGMDGQELHDEMVFLNFLRLQDVFMMVTAEDYAPMVLASLVFEPDAYLTKPFGVDVLKQRLDRALIKKSIMLPAYEKMENNDGAGALQELKRIAGEYPRLSMACAKLQTKIYRELEQFDKAEEICSEVILYRPMPWALLGVGTARHDRGEFEAAREFFEEALMHNPNFLPAYDALAKSLLAMGKVDLAQDVLEKAIKISPKAVERQLALAEIAAKNDDPEARLKAYRNAVRYARYNRHKSVDHYVELSKSLLENMSGEGGISDHRLAEETKKQIKQIKRDFTGDAEALVRGRICQADLHDKQGHEKLGTEARQEVLEQVESMDDDTFSRADTFMEIADAYVKDGQEDKADHMLQRALERYGDDERVRHRIKAKLGQYAPLRDEELAAERNASGVECFKEGKMDEALKMFEEATHLAPRNHSYCLNMAQALIELSKQGSAQEMLNRAETYLARVQHMPKQDYRYARYQKLAKEHKDLVKKL